jgi:glutamate synthase domain-containing protein 3
MKKSVWLSYDLDLVSGDYEGLFTLLDQLNAKECGTNLAFFEIEAEDKNVEEKVKQLIESNVKLTKNDRIYVIYRKENKVKGKFLVGKRKINPPWKGFAYVVEEEDISDEDDSWLM